MRFKGQRLISHNGFHFVLALRHAFDAVIGSAQGGNTRQFSMFPDLFEGGVGVITLMSGQKRNRISVFLLSEFALHP